MRAQAAAMICVLAACGAREESDGAAHGVVEARRIDVGSKTGGRVIEVLAREGSVVEAGAVLVRFDPDELRAANDAARARLAEAEARALQLRRGSRREEIEQAEAAARQAAVQLAALRSGPRSQEIDQARAELRAVEAEAANTETSRKRLAALLGSGDVPRQAVDDATARRDAAQARSEAVRERVRLLEAGTRAEDVRAAGERLAQAEKAAALTRAGPRAEEIAQAAARVEQAKADLARTGAQLREAEVRSPARCRVESIAVRPGDLAPPGRAVAALLEEDQTWIRVYVPEPELGAWRVGAEAEATTSARPGQWLPAVVEQIAAQGEFLPRNVQTASDRAHLVFAVKVRVRDAGTLRPGMAASARIKAK